MDEITNTNRAVIDIRCLTWFTERETHLSVTLDRHALEWKRKAETAFPDSLHSPAAVSERRQIGEPHNRGPSVAHPEASPHPNSVHRWQGTPQHKCNKSQSDHRERKGFLWLVCGRGLWGFGECIQFLYTPLESTNPIKYLWCPMFQKTRIVAAIEQNSTLIFRILIQKKCLHRYYEQTESSLQSQKVSEL